jgi:aminoacyl tRNA synthase complex-interacting multifunctional protein 1
VELLFPPEGSQAGDVVTFSGFERQPPAELPKKNPWDTVQPKLSINAEGVACWDNIPFTTDKGIVKSKTVKNGIIQ